ncbi:YdcF family protein [Candidatus Kuenenbacteria bacterium]|nr:YdcF family protein [Candidatus Kuenenbacteria bacterium]
MDIGIEKANPTSYKKGVPKFLKTIVIVFLLFCFIVFLIVIRVQFKYSDKIINDTDLTSPNVGLVFGAGLKAKGVPGAVLEDRILTAIKLYQDGRLGKFILAGDNSTAGHNEVQAMKNSALELGLNEDAILEDHAGLSTYDSCLHVKESFGLNKIVLITQKYHLRRALYICNELGIDARGIASENRGYSSQFKFTVREWLASVEAWLKVK